VFINEDTKKRGASGLSVQYFARIASVMFVLRSRFPLLAGYGHKKNISAFVSYV
jgi:hypothetical protein